MLILVTGASRGIGFELVKSFAAIEGALVIAVSRNVKSLGRLNKSLPNHNVLAVQADINVEKDQKRLAAIVKNLQLPLDILINNAGQIVNKPFLKINQQDLVGVFATNVFAPYRLIQLMVPFLGRSPFPHVLNISSMGGVQGSVKFAGLSAYSSSKAAIAVLSECLAEELKSFNIRVNCLALGAVQTEMLSRAFPGYTAPLAAYQMAEFITDFAQSGHRYFNGKVLPVSISTP